MERLTVICPGGTAIGTKYGTIQSVIDDCRLGEVFDKLGEYEDTGLTAEEINDFKAWLNEDREDLNDITIFNDLSELIKYRKTGVTPEGIYDLMTRFHTAVELWENTAKTNCELNKERNYWEREAKK